MALLPRMCCFLLDRHNSHSWNDKVGSCVKLIFICGKHDFVDNIYIFNDINIRLDESN